MIFWKSYFLKEIKLASSEGGIWFLGAIQTLLCGILFPLALSASPALLTNLATGIIWSCTLLGCLIPIDGIFASDLKDGSFEFFICENISLSIAALLKILATWIVRCLPIIAASCLLAFFFNYPLADFSMLLITLCIGSLIFCFLGGMSAALMPYGKKGNSLIGLILLPLCMPVIIFGTLANESSTVGFMAFNLLSGLLFLMVPLCAIITGIALREQISHA